MKSFPVPSTISCKMDGFIHSLESFGTVDGPGIRFVIFCQGCPMRCQYCHNPDTWNFGQGQRMSAQAIMDEFRKNRMFYANGGITVTGGEPLLQIDFLLELFHLAKQEGIHTCIDTSGITYRPEVSEYNRKLDQLMSLTDLVMLDLKHMDPQKHQTLTGQSNAGILAFARYLDTKRIPLWIRHVLVPGITSDEKQLVQLGRFMASLSNVTSLDVLPYHTMGLSKYENLGLAYPLPDVAPATKDEALHARNIILTSYRHYRQNTKKEQLSST